MVIYAFDMEMESENKLIDLAGMVRLLNRAVCAESHKSGDGRTEYHQGKSSAYCTVYEIIREELDLDKNELDRRIDENYASWVLHLKEDGAYSLIYRKGQIITVSPMNEGDIWNDK